MYVNVQINLGPNEYAADLSGNATELAVKILKGIGGDPEKDIVNVLISDSGSAGAMPVPPSLPEPTPVAQEDK